MTERGLLPDGEKLADDVDAFLRGRSELAKSDCLPFPAAEDMPMHFDGDKEFMDIKHEVISIFISEVYPDGKEPIGTLREEVERLKKELPMWKYSRVEWSKGYALIEEDSMEDRMEIQAVDNLTFKDIFNYAELRIGEITEEKMDLVSDDDEEYLQLEKEIDLMAKISEIAYHADEDFRRDGVPNY